MPVGTTIGIATDDGVLLEAMVTEVREQTTGAATTPGMMIKPKLEVDAAPLTEYGGIAWLDLDSFSRTWSSDQDFGRADNARAEDRYWDAMTGSG